MGLGILQYQHEVIRRSNVSLTKDIMTIRALIHSFLMHTFQYNNQVSSHKLTPSTHASITHAHIPLQQQSSSAEQKMQKRLSHKRTPSIQYIQYIITHAHTPIQQPSSCRTQLTHKMMTRAYAYYNTSTKSFGVLMCH